MADRNGAKASRLTALAFNCSLKGSRNKEKSSTEILLRHFPEVHVTGIDINDEQLAEARRFLATVPWATGRYDIRKMDAQKLEFDPESFESHLPALAAR